MYSKTSALLMTLIVGVGIGLRCYGLPDRTFWFDEAFSDRLIHDFSWSEMIGRTGRDVHPPFYYIALRLWAGVFGCGIVTLRLFSVVMAGLTFVGAYQLTFEAYAYGRGAFDHWRAQAAGLSAAALLATTTLHIYWSQEARMYSLATALLAWSSWFLLRALRLDALRWYIAYAVAAEALMYTHNYGLFAVCAHGIVIVAYFLAKGWESLRAPATWRAATVLFITSCLYLPWLPVLLSQTRRVAADYWIARLNWWSLPDACQELVFPVNAPTVSDHLTSVFVAAGAVVIVGYLAWRPNIGRGLLLASVVVPVGVSIAVSLVSVPIAHSRYYQLAYVAAVCGLSGLLYRFEPMSLGAVLSVVLAAVGVGYTHYFYNVELQVRARPGIKGAVEYIRQNIGRDEPVVVTHPCVYYSVRRYLRGELTPVLYLPTGRLSHYMGLPIFLPEDACGAEELAAIDRSRVWVVETTGYTLNWTTQPLPSVWERDVGSGQVFPEIGYFQGVVSVYTCHRDAGNEKM